MSRSWGYYFLALAAYAAALVVVALIGFMIGGGGAAGLGMSAMNGFIVGCLIGHIFMPRGAA